MTTELFSDNAATTLTSSPTTGATSFTVASSTGFPAAVTGTSQFRVIIGTEIITVTNVSGTTWTCVATAAAHTSADVVTHVLTAASLGNFVDGKITAQHTTDNGFYARRRGLVVDVVKDYGAVVDGTTDDTTAWQNAINAVASAGGGTITSSLQGVSIIGGALQDTSGANAQLLLPSVHALDTKQISITIAGSTPPPTTFSVVGATPVPDGHLVLKSTLNAGAGGALLGGYGPAGSYLNFTNIFLRLENVAFRMPSNPVLSGLNLSLVTCVDLDNVVVDVGSYYVQGLTEPTTTTSYGIQLPGNNDGAYTRLGAVNVIGFYNGFLLGEHTVGEQVTAWGCKKAAVAPAVYHASKFSRFMAVHCQRGIVFTGVHYIDIDQFNIEHAASGWWAPVYDVDDASNYGHGTFRWHVVLAGVGVDTTFLINGATGINCTQVGEAGGIYVAFTSAMTATTTNPTLGTGGSAIGRYYTDGQHIEGDIVVQFGTSGAYAGAGSYRFLLPAPMSTVLAGVVGMAYAYDASTGVLPQGQLGKVTSTTVQFLTTSGVVFGSTAPFIPTNDDTFVIHFSYEKA